MFKRQSKLYKRTIFRTTFGIGIVAFTTGLLSGCEPRESEEMAQIQKKESEILRPSDKDIASAIRYRFWDDAGVNANALQVFVTDGVATLEGHVDNLEEKHRAVEISLNIKGVRSAIDRISVIPVKVQDAQLQNDVGQALLTLPGSEPSVIQASVKDGEVTLSGTVQSWAERQFVELKLYGVRGVRKIHNKIDVETVRSPHPEQDIKSDIENRLASDLLVDDSAIQVRVDGMEVKLSGKVSSAAERARAAYDAWLVGVAKVDDSGLVVEPWEYDIFRRPGDGFAPDTDSDIEKSIRDAFLFDPRVLSPELSVTVVEGMATITGTVDNLPAKIAAAEDARNTVGVFCVRNQTKINPVDKVQSDKVAHMGRRNSLTPDCVYTTLHGGHGSSVGDTPIGFDS